MTTNTLLNAIAAAARMGLSRASIATGIAATLYANAQNRLPLMVPRVRRASRIASGTRSRSPETMVRSAAVMAASVPVPIAMPRSAWARAAASFTPSPTIATTRPDACSSRIVSSLPCGVTPARTSSMPASSAMVRAAPGLSPVSRIGVSPSPRSRAMASRLVGLMVSATLIAPRACPSHATTVTVAPAASSAVIVAASSSGIAIAHCPVIQVARPAATMRPSTMPCTP